MGTPTYCEDATDSTSRAGEVPNASWTDGCNYAASNAPGIGINMNEGAVVGTPAQFTLLDQDGAARTPQVSALIGNTGFVNRSSVDWPSSGGSEGKGTVPLRDATVDASGDGSLSPNGTCQLGTLAEGWVNIPTP